MAPRARCINPLVSNLAIALAALDARVVVLRGRKTESLTVPQLYANAGVAGQ